MVVVEVPLWLIHKKSDGLLDVSSTRTATTTADRTTEQDDDHDPSSSTMNGGGGMNGTAPTTVMSDASKALHASELWQPTTKCPIYGLDIHQSMIATAGGDGAVRIWNSAALFAHHHRPGTLTSDFTGYVSYESSSDSDKEGDDEGDSEDSSKGKPPKGSSGKNGGVVSNESDSDNSSSADSSSSSQVQVHDLTSVVRRKTTDGGDGPTSSPPRLTNNPQSPSRASSSKRHHHPSNHHHRLVTTLTGHSGHSVLAVRFSTSGKYLASGGDDCMVMVYSMPRSNATASSSDPSHHPHHAYWPRKHICSGHDLDVIDLAWSPDDAYLVSCSLDSHHPICVWNLENNSQQLRLTPYRVLGAKIHTSTVRGITFDPAGSYLASSGDDPAVCIWRTHDDWGLEAKIVNIFHSSNTMNASSTIVPTFVRRLSWSTDGSFVCCTNAVVKNRHVAATLQRQSWNNSSMEATSSSAAASAVAATANLVGHKQPVVVCRHSSHLLQAKEDGEDAASGDGEPEYATLLALGDKQGLVTIWTTKSSRPIFKLQCASHTTVTDLAWGTTTSTSNNKDEELLLLVSQLDGAITALKFGPNELPPLLSAQQQARVFQIKYGMEAGSSALGGLLLTGYKAQQSQHQQSKFVESALALARDQEDEDVDDDLGGPFNDEDDQPPPPPEVNRTLAPQVTTATAGGKKRVRPVLVAVGASPKRPTPSTSVVPQTKKRKSLDPVQEALEAAEKAQSATALVPRPHGEAADLSTSTATPKSPSRLEPTRTAPTEDGAHVSVASMASSWRTSAAFVIPYNADRIQTADLPLISSDSDPSQSNLTQAGLSAECVNSLSSTLPGATNGTPIRCLDVAIRREGQVSWRDSIPGTHVCAVSASPQFLAVGTIDGTLQLYGTSPRMGWKSGHAFRSHPPLVFGHPVTTLRLKEVALEGSDTTSNDQVRVELLVVTSDGSFAVYELVPNLKLQYKGSLLPALHHMDLSSRSRPELNRLPELSRVQFLDSGRLFALIGYRETAPGSGMARDSRATSREAPIPTSVGGSLQGFVYDRLTELWVRVADSRFVLSDCYSSLPTKGKGVLGRLEDCVRLGSAESTLKDAYRQTGVAMLRHDEIDSRKFLATRSHCEDRMACAILLESASEFKDWLAAYIRILAVAGHEDAIRQVVDQLVNSGSFTTNESSNLSCWWLAQAPDVMGMDRSGLVKSVVLPELRKNRSLQRLTNEITLETKIM